MAAARQPHIAFNTGIELGQALIIISVCPLLLLVRRLRWPQVAQTGASGLIAGVGVLLLFTRLPLNKSQRPSTDIAELGRPGSG
jgi:hypothetical protein